MKFVQIDGGIVTATYSGRGAPADPPEGRVFVEVEDYPALLSTYDGKTFTAPAPPLDFGATMSPRDFLLLFTLAERQAIRRLAVTDADLEDMIGLVLVSQSIRVKHPLTTASLHVLVTKGLITAARVTEIQSSVPPTAG